MDHSSENLFSHCRYFCLSTIILAIFGLMMVYSSSYIYAKEVYDNSAYYFWKQLSFLFVALGVAFIIGKTKINFWLKYGFQVNCLFTVLLILTLIPGVGESTKGASRWISLMGFRFQPGEFLKVSCILSGLYLCEKWTLFNNKKRALCLSLILLPLVLLIKQPDFGTFSICLAVLVFTAFLSQIPRLWFYSTSFIGLVISGILLFSQPYRVKRVMAFLNPWENAQTSGFQIIQSYLAFANGSFWGQGLGNSTEKLFYLPEAHNDFIFSIVGAELGFIGVLGVVLLFLALIYFGFQVALSLKLRTHAVLVSSLVFCLGFQAFLNMAVVLGLVPTKGLNLPFISAGGTALVANGFIVGLILSATRHSLRVFSNREQGSGEQDITGYSSPSRLPL